jgi:hypothetical protein
VNGFKEFITAFIHQYKALYGDFDDFTVGTLGWKFPLFVFVTLI